MKKIIVLIGLLLFSGITFSQTFEKGQVLGIHVNEIVLQPDVTYNQYKEFMMNKAFPKFEEAYKGDVKLYLIEGIKGENKDKIGWIFLFKSSEAFKKWITEEGGINEALSDEFWKTVSDVMDEQNKYVKANNRTFTDWVVQ